MQVPELPLEIRCEILLPHQHCVDCGAVISITFPGCLPYYEFPEGIHERKAKVHRTGVRVRH